VLDYFGGLAEQSHLTVSQAGLTSAVIVGVGIIGNAAAAVFARRVSQGAALEDRTLIEMLSAAIDVIVPFHTAGEIYEIGEVWLAADARRRGETVGHLLSET
jgi:type IV secretion system protein VirB11